jgi:hypothetical protein
MALNRLGFVAPTGCRKFLSDPSNGWESSIPASNVPTVISQMAERLKALSLKIHCLRGPLAAS